MLIERNNSDVKSTYVDSNSNILCQTPPTQALFCPFLAWIAEPGELAHHNHIQRQNWISINDAVHIVLYSLAPFLLSLLVQIC